MQNQVILKEDESILIASNNGADTTLNSQLHKGYNNQDVIDLYIDFSRNKAKLSTLDLLNFPFSSWRN